MEQNIKIRGKVIDLLKERLDNINSRFYKIDFREEFEDNEDFRVYRDKCMEILEKYPYWLKIPLLYKTKGWDNKYYFFDNSGDLIKRLKKEIEKESDLLIGEESSLELFKRFLKNESIESITQDKELMNNLKKDEVYIKAVHKISGYGKCSMEDIVKEWADRFDIKDLKRVKRLKKRMSVIRRGIKEKKHTIKYLKEKHNDMCCMLELEKN